MTKNSKVSVGLSILACIGVGVTAFLATKNDKKFSASLEEARSKKHSANDELTKKEEIIIFGKSFWPTLTSGAVTCGCIIGAQVLDIKEIAAMGGLLAAATYKYNDAMNYIHDKYPDEYDEIKSYVNNEAYKRKLEDSPKYSIEETYDGRKRYYFPLSDQIVYMKPEDLIKVQSYISSQFGTKLEVTLNEILDYIHYDLGYKDVHTNRADYIWEFEEDDETCMVETYHFPELELEYDDILDDSGEYVVCQVVSLNKVPKTLC